MSPVVLLYTITKIYFGGLTSKTGHYKTLPYANPPPKKPYSFELEIQSTEQNLFKSPFHVPAKSNCVIFSGVLAVILSIVNLFGE